MANENDGMPPGLNVVLGMLKGNKPSLEVMQAQVECELRTDYFNFYRLAAKGLFANLRFLPYPEAKGFADTTKQFADALFLSSIEGMNGMEGVIKQRAMERVILTAHLDEPHNPLNDPELSIDAEFPLSDEDQTEDER